MRFKQLPYRLLVPAVLSAVGSLALLWCSVLNELRLDRLLRQYSAKQEDYLTMKRVPWRVLIPTLLVVVGSVSIVVALAADLVGGSGGFGAKQVKLAAVGSLGLLCGTLSRLNDRLGVFTLMAASSKPRDGAGWNTTVSFLVWPADWLCGKHSLVRPFIHQRSNHFCSTSYCLDGAVGDSAAIPGGGDLADPGGAALAAGGLISG